MSNLIKIFVILICASMNFDLLRVLDLEVLVLIQSDNPLNLCVVLVNLACLVIDSAKRNFESVLVQV